jgi:PTH1 family peptidyl-tRNA hydrolase
MKLIVAQGNPGTQYTRSRHNTGFMALDAYAEAHGAPWKTETKFNADIASLTVEGEKVLLVKPLSFYNETGQVARALVDFYKLSPAEDVLVVHDELALPFGTLRVREKGSDAGNNGVKSLNAHLGEAYRRIRVGVWSDERNYMDDVAFVLGSFSTEQQAQLQSLITEKIIPLLDEFAAGTLENSSHTHPVA